MVGYHKIISDFKNRSAEKQMDSQIFGASFGFFSKELDQSSK